jgi:DNA-binding MarR family transcriptional regulator
MFEQDIGAKVKRISNLMKREIDKLLGEKDMITKNQGMILRLLKSSPTPLYQKDIEQELSIRRSTATKILNIMEQKGLIIREKSTEDARRKKLILTDKGKQLENKNYCKIEEIENKIKENLTKEEQENLLAILNKIEKTLIKEENKDD